MHRILPIILLIFALLACSRQRKYPIESIRLDQSHYLESITDIAQAISQNPSDATLRRRYLLVNRELRWPDDVSEDIALIKKQHGLDYELLQYAVDFYQAYHYYEHLLGIIEEWESLNGTFPRSERLKVTALMGLQRLEEAKYILWKMIQSNKSDQVLMEFAAENYLKLNDSTRAVYAYNRIAELNPSNPKLLEAYVPLLLDRGYLTRAMKVLNNQKIDSADVNGHLLLARTFYQLGEGARAHELLAPYQVPQVLYQRAEWYESKYLWDSATLCINRVIEQDSSITAILKKATLLENRGWLSSSYALYSSILLKDSTNGIAQEGARNVARKIAYLRSLREAEETIPILDISSKKETENE